MLAPLGFAPIDHQVTDQGVGTCQDCLTQVVGHAGRLLITRRWVGDWVGRIRNRHQRMRWCRWWIAGLTPIRCYPTGVDLHGPIPGRAKARIGHNDIGRQPTWSVTCLQLAGQTPSACASILPYSPRYARLHTGWPQSTVHCHTRPQSGSPGVTARTSLSGQSTQQLARQVVRLYRVAHEHRALIVLDPLIHEGADSDNRPGSARLIACF